MSSPIVKSNRPEDASLSASPADPTFYLPTVESSRFTDALKRFGWLAVLLAVAAAGATWYALDRVPETYLATGSVYVSTQAPEFFEIEGLGVEESRDLEQLQSVEQGMLSKSLLLRLIERHGLMEDESFAPDAESRQQVLGVLEERVHVALRRGNRFKHGRIYVLCGKRQASSRQWQGGQAEKGGDGGAGRKRHDDPFRTTVYTKHRPQPLGSA
jgi:hypothetical protein